MHEITAFFNEHYADLVNQVMGTFGIHAADPKHPWQVWLLTEVLVILLLMIGVAILRSRLSVDKPGKVQHTLELIYSFLGSSTEEVGIHHGAKYVPYFGTIFIFVLVSNLIGIIPAFESPTMFPAVALGLAVMTFGYYNWAGFSVQGVGKYLKHFMGPMVVLAPLMIPIEIISHLARPLSLTVRLYANMFAGEKVTLAFIPLTFLVGPAIFMGLHVFVSILQAYVFALLTMIYVSSAVAHEH